MLLKKTIFSLKFTALILFVLLFLLLLNVLLPQERVLGKEKLKEISEKNKFYYFIFNKLNLKDIPSSPIFLFFLFLFYFQLIFFIFKYIKTTLNKIKIREPHYVFWKRFKIVNLKKSFYEDLKKRGFKYFKLKDGGDYFVENELSPLGFMLFHISFFFFLTGGIFISYTRGVSIANLALGQTINLEDPLWVEKIKKPIFEEKKDIMISLNEVYCNWDSKEGLPLKFKSHLTIIDKGKKISDYFEINKPLKYKNLNFYPNYSEDAYIIEIEDPQGYIIEKPILFSKCKRGKEIKFNLTGGFEGKFLCDKGERILIFKGNFKEELNLKENEAIFLENYKIKFLSKVPWVEIKIVEERGGIILILGFILGSLGIILRFLFPKREIVIKEMEIFIKADYFPENFLNFLQKFLEVQNGKN